MELILQLEDISKYIGELALYTEVSFEISEGDKVALIGPNGAGKSTLLKMIFGEESPDSGTIRLLPEKKIAFLTQEPALKADHTIMESLFRSDNEFLGMIRSYEEAVLSGDINQIGKTTLEMDRFKLWDFESRIRQILTRLDITDLHQKVSELSGGQQKRIALANVILNEPDLLLLDEPTNHLDLEVIEWIEDYIGHSRLSLIMVTHDRYFLDRVCNTILEIDQKRIHRYPGNYSRFVELRKKRIELEQIETDKARNLLRKEEEWMRRMPKARGTKAKYRMDQYYVLKDISQRKRNDKKLDLSIRESRSGSKILVAKNLNFSWRGTPYLQNFTYTFSRYEKIGILGKNGSGKTTFLEVLMQNLRPESGTLEIGETMKFGYYRQAGMSFKEDSRVIEAITEIAETVLLTNGTIVTAAQFLSYFLFPHSRQNDLICKLSGGEKRRLYLCQILMQNPNFLILDEPTNDLDIASLQVLEEYLASFNGCTLIVSHDRYFLDSVADHLFVFTGEGIIKDIPGNYSFYLDWKNRSESSQDKQAVKLSPTVRQDKISRKENKNKLSYKERRELELLESEIAVLERRKEELENLLSGGNLSPGDLNLKSELFSATLTELQEKTNRWFELSEKEQ